jgi:hypothetical protein
MKETDVKYVTFYRGDEVIEALCTMIEMVNSAMENKEIAERAISALPNDQLDYFITGTEYLNKCAQTIKAER